ncbi:MAG: PCRF domain-containing protein, partial [Actinomycetota bacterium]|nr:PCRF domain-containing protein [Actinomycetota bacterium]
MDERLSERLIATDEEFESNLALLADPGVIADQKRYREVTGRHAELKPIVDAYRRYRDAETESEEAAELATIEDDAEMIEYLNGVVAAKRVEMEETEMDLRRLLIPKDPNDDKDVIVEIRSAAGGDEASLWAGDLYRMYERFAERSRWAIEPINVSLSDGGGLKEATFAVKGKGAY